MNEPFSARLSLLETEGGEYFVRLLWGERNEHGRPVERRLRVRCKSEDQFRRVLELIEKHTGLSLDLKAPDT